jgi:hypothetical protein
MRWETAVPGSCGCVCVLDADQRPNGDGENEEDERVQHTPVRASNRRVVGPRAARVAEVGETARAGQHGG